MTSAALVQALVIAVMFAVSAVTLAAPALAAWAYKRLDTDKYDRLQAGCETAYLLVEQIARRTPADVDDKLANALDVLRNELRLVKTQEDEKKAIVMLRANHEARVIAKQHDDVTKNGSAGEIG